MIYSDELKMIHKNILSWYELEGETLFITEECEIEGEYDNIVVIPEVALDVMEVVRNAVSHLVENGTLIVAADNKFALKYYSGVANESTGEFFGSITGKDSATISLKDIKEMESYGLSLIETYYPYPDARLPRAIFRKDFIEEKHINPASFTPSFEKDRYVIFDEAAAMQELIGEGLWESFVNAYLLVFRKTVSEAGDSDNTNSNEQLALDGVLYARFNTERAPEYRVDTYIKRVDGKMYVDKKADGEEAKTHIKRIIENYDRAGKLYKAIKPVSYELVDDETIRFPYLEGIALDKKLAEEIRDTESKDDVFQLIKSALDRVFNYGDDMLDEDGNPKISNVDSIFSNYIYVKDDSSGEDTDGQLYLIDYEWIYDKAMPIDYLKYRACLYFYQDHSDIEKKFPLNELLERLGITEEENQKYAALEDKFQQKIYGEDWKYQITKHFAKKNISFAGLEEDFRLKEDHIRNLEESNAKLRKMLKNPVAGVGEIIHKKFSK